MTVGILGRGRMGTALATAITASDERVLLAGRAPASDVDIVVRQADILILALPFHAALDLVGEGRLGAGRGRTLVDATNPYLSGRHPRAGESGGQLLASGLPDWHVVKALNTVPADMLARPVLDDRPVTVPVAGDDPGAKAAVFGLVRRLGFAPVDAGGIQHAGELEALAYLLVTISAQHRLAGRVGFQLAVAEPIPASLPVR